MNPTDDHILFITLDSCRYDTFAASYIPHMKAVAPFYKAQAPSYFTYGSHSAMFVGFTPGIAGSAQRFFDPKFGKLFKIVGVGYPGKETEGYALSGRNIIEGFNNLGYKTYGTAAMAWFDPSSVTGAHLTDSFSHFFYPGPHSLHKQIEFVNNCLAQASGSTFTFMNIGETHVPYWYEGAAWSADDNPCVPYQLINRSKECRSRQRESLEFIDRQLAALLRRYMDGTIIICADHGDCWGEDGLWEHAFMHEKTTTVPLIIRYRGEPCRLQNFSRTSSGAPSRLNSFAKSFRPRKPSSPKLNYPAEGKHDSKLHYRNVPPSLAMIDQGKKRIIVVLGMHRSGTSAITRGLQAVGVELGDRLMPGEESNRKGFFEDQDIYELNCELLHALGRDWHHLSPISLGEMDTQHKNPYFFKAVELLLQKSGGRDIFGFKDPRTIKLFPFWKKIAIQCHLDISCVLAIRHPFSVSQSLKKRNGFHAEKNYFLWLGHIVESLSGSAGLKRVLVDYDKLMLSPELELNRIAEKLDLKIDQIELKTYKSEFLDKALRHTIYCVDDLSLDDACPPLVREIYTALLEIASDKADLENRALQNQIESWVNEYERLKPILALVDKASARMIESDKQNAELRSRIEDLYASTSWRLTRPMRAAKIIISKSAGYKIGATKLP
jgi:hypothetical protein